MNWTRIRKQLGNRSAVVGAGVAGFLVGAGGFVAAQIDDSPAGEVEVESGVEVESEVEVEVESESSIADPTTSTDDTRPPSTAPDSTALSPRVIAPTSIDLTVPVVTVDDSGTDDSSSSTTVDDRTDDSSSSTTVDDRTDDSSTDTSVGDRADDSGTDDSSSSTSSVAASLPAPFSRSYESGGGSIAVSWTGTALVLDAIGPAPGFVAEIEDQSWDRIRVDFEGDADTRIEVRLDDGQIRVRVD